MKLHRVLTAVVAVALLLVLLNAYAGPLMLSHHAGDTDTGRKTGIMDGLSHSRPRHPSGNAVNFLVSSRGVSVTPVARVVVLGTFLFLFLLL